MSRRFRWYVSLTLAAYLCLLSLVLGQSDASLAIGVVGGFADLLAAGGAPAAVTDGARIELVLNAAMFAPLPFLAGVLFPRHPWANWVVYGFLASTAVEVVQGMWMPLRSAQYVDIVANTAGCIAGAALSAITLRGVNAQAASPERSQAGKEVAQ